MTAPTSTRRKWTPQGRSSLSRISTGSEGTGNSDSCQPYANTVHEHWNTTGSRRNMRGRGDRWRPGPGQGRWHNLFPLAGEARRLGSGVENAPNLYVARPGNPPTFVTTLESSANAPLPLPAHPFVRSFGAFSNPTGVAIDPATKDIYVLDVGTNQGQGFVYKFTADGRSDLSFGENGKITVSGVVGLFNFPTQTRGRQRSGEPELPRSLRA